MKSLDRVFLSMLLTLPNLFFCSESSAQEAIVRSSLGTKEEPYVGQKAILVLELLVPGFFSGAPSFDLPDSGGILLVPPAESPVVGSEDRNGVSYTVQRHEIALFAEQPGEQVIAPFLIRFAFKRKSLDKDPVSVVVKTEAIHFSVQLPPGAEKLGNVISAHDLKVNETWKPPPGKAKAGDAFVRTITYSATDVPGMIFPPFPAAQIDGLGIYPKQPELLDTSDRGKQRGERRELFTYVCKRPGRFTVPASKLTWWDLESKKLETIQFPARTFEVSANPAFPSSADPSLSKRKRGMPSYIIFAALIVMVGLTAFLLIMGTRSKYFEFLRPVHLASLNPTESHRQEEI